MKPTVKQGLKKFFKASAFTAALSLSGAMALPYLEQEAQPPPASAHRLTLRADIPDVDVSESAKGAVSRLQDGTLVIDGFKDAKSAKIFGVGEFPVGNRSVLNGPATVIINSHGGGRYYLDSDDNAPNSIHTYDIQEYLTAENPEVVFVFACNGDAATPDDVAAMIDRPDRRLRAIIMVEPGFLGATSRSMPVIGTGGVIGRTLIGTSADPGAVSVISQFWAMTLEGESVGKLARYTLSHEGKWERAGTYEADNLYDLIDPTPLGWARDFYGMTLRGPDIVFDELRAINAPDSPLTYGEKVSRNLARPIGTLSLSFNRLFHKIKGDPISIPSHDLKGNKHMLPPELNVKNYMRYADAKTNQLLGSIVSMGMFQEQSLLMFGDDRSYRLAEDFDEYYIRTWNDILTASQNIEYMSDYDKIMLLDRLRSTNAQILDAWDGALRDDKLKVVDSSTKNQIKADMNDMYKRFEKALRPERDPSPLPQPPLS